jgi:hypothetical protein
MSDDHWTPDDDLIDLAAVNVSRKEAVSILYACGKRIRAQAKAEALREASKDLTLLDECFGVPDFYQHEVLRRLAARADAMTSPKPGDRFINGWEPGVMVTCGTCDGMGLLHSQDNPPEPVEPMTPQQEATDE